MITIVNSEELFAKAAKKLYVSSQID